MSKYREVFDVLQSTEYAEASESLAALLAAGRTTELRVIANKPEAVTRSFLEEVGLDGWASEDRYQNGFYSLTG
jgi:phosphoglycolate phosphatase-like HAD superfamily hydrolase